MIAKRLAAICMELVKKEKFFSVESPKDSLLIELKEFRQLAKMNGVFFVELDQCAYGGEAKKTTWILTNAPWVKLVARRCHEVAQHEHVILEGLVEDFTGPGGSSSHASGKKGVFVTLWTGVALHQAPAAVPARNHRARWLQV